MLNLEVTLTLILLVTELTLATDVAFIIQITLDTDVAPSLRQPLTVMWLSFRQPLTLTWPHHSDDP